MLLLPTRSGGRSGSGSGASHGDLCLRGEASRLGSSPWAAVRREGGGRAATLLLLTQQPSPLRASLLVLLLLVPLYSRLGLGARSGHCLRLGECGVFFYNRASLQEC